MSLFKHMREHFRDEEQLMKQTDYPALNVHVAAHNELLDILVGISDSIANSNSFRTLHDFMQSKFLTHTLSLDIEFGKFQSQYLSEKNSKPGK
jgi:hemerythrin-like metal-binding protein